MKVGLVLEGGGMRGMYTAGILDIMMENNINVDGVIGVSAGAVFGCNYKSKQIGRVIRYNSKYCKDPRYVSIRSLIKTGDIYGEEFCYHELPDKLDPFDTDTFVSSKVEFYVVCTDVHTGEAVYKKCTEGDKKDIQWMRASASMPLVSRIVDIDGGQYLDGGIADSIPIEYFINNGYNKNIVILTKPKGYSRKKSKAMPLFNIGMRKYPAVINGMKNRHIMYNNQLAKLDELESKGDVLIIRPDRPIKIGRAERNPNKLMETYELGRKDGLKYISKMKEMINDGI